MVSNAHADELVCRVCEIVVGYNSTSVVKNAVLHFVPTGGSDS